MTAPDPMTAALPPLPPHLAIRYVVFARALGRSAADAFARRALAAESDASRDAECEAPVARRPTAADRPD